MLQISEGYKINVFTKNSTKKDYIVIGISSQYLELNPTRVKGAVRKERGHHDAESWVLFLQNLRILLIKERNLDSPF